MGSNFEHRLILQTLSPEESKAAFRNEYDFDSPAAIDFDLLVDHLRDIKSGYANRLHLSRMTS